FANPLSRDLFAFTAGIEMPVPESGGSAHSLAIRALQPTGNNTFPLGILRVLVQILSTQRRSVLGLESGLAALADFAFDLVIPSGRWTLKMSEVPVADLPRTTDADVQVIAGDVAKFEQVVMNPPPIPIQIQAASFEIPTTGMLANRHVVTLAGQ